MKLRLSDMKKGQMGEIVKIEGTGSVKRHILDMGVVPKTKITVIRVAPLADPVDFELKGYHLSLRKRDAQNIVVELING